MAFLFRRPEQDSFSISASASPQSQWRDNHHIDTMAPASLKIRTAEEAGMSHSCSVPEPRHVESPPSELLFTDSVPNSGKNCIFVQRPNCVCSARTIN